MRKVTDYGLMSKVFSSVDFYPAPSYLLPMKVIAHRGDSERAPENTMKAFQLAWTAGADGVECDIHLTSDGEIIVYHDLDGRRLSGDSRFIAECDSTTIQSWRVGSEQIPSLKQVLSAAPASSLTMIEIKSGTETLAPLHDLLQSFSGHAFAILSFNPDIAARSAELSMPTWLNVEAPMTGNLDFIINEMKRHSIEGLSLGWSTQINQDVVRRVHDAGLALAVWTVNDLSQVRKAIDWGVDVLMTDRPSIITPLVKHA